MRQHYEEQKQMTAKDFQTLISPPTVKKTRSKRKKVTGGCEGCEYAGGCSEYSGIIKVQLQKFLDNFKIKFPE